MLSQDTNGYVYRTGMHTRRTISIKIYQRIWLKILKQRSVEKDLLTEIRKVKFIRNGVTIFMFCSDNNSMFYSKSKTV